MEKAPAKRMAGTRKNCNNKLFHVAIIHSSCCKNSLKSKHTEISCKKSTVGSFTDDNNNLSTGQEEEKRGMHVPLLGHATPHMPPHEDHCTVAVEYKKTPNSNLQFHA